MAIAGVQIVPLRQIPDDRGKVMHMLRRDEPHFLEFGEIYFSTVYPGLVKGWHLHKRMTLNYACVLGMIKLVLYDTRDGSPSFHQLQEVYLGESNYALAVVPPGIWNGFMGLGMVPAMVANCASIPHDPDEIVRMDPHSGEIPYTWKVVDR